MSKLDQFIYDIQLKTKKPVKSIYEMTLDSYVLEEKRNEVKDKVFDEFCFYMLNDFIDGCEMVAISYGYNKEVEHLKDVISICKQKTVIMDLANSLQKIRIDLNRSLKNIYENDKVLLERFIFLGMAYQDKRYISFLVEHLMEKEKLTEDDLIQKINKRIMENQTFILKIKD